MPKKLKLSLIDGYAQTKEMPERQRDLVWLSSFLQPDERTLVMAVLIDGQPIRLAARLLGQPYMNVRSRVLKLSRQLASRKYLAAARLVPYLSPGDATLAKLHFCSGLSCRSIGRMLGISLHDLRRQFDRITVRIDTIAQLCSELENADAPAPDSGQTMPLRRTRQHPGRALLTAAAMAQYT